ncbi:MAG TPA: ABC transporter permease [Acidimicrobiales bacterium]|nr:ABC transporter permease [Acidimicrobiales bacterium]
MIETPESVTAITLAAATAGRSRRRALLRRATRDRGAVLGAVLFVLLVAAVATAPLLSPFDPTSIDPRHALAHSSRLHPLGTDLLGRDVLSRLLHGGRTSVAAALAAGAGVATLGLLFGVVAGTIGGAVDTVIMRLVDILLALPLLVVAMVAVGLLGGGTDKLVLTVILLGWPVHARVVRAVALSIREQAFVQAAAALGASRLRIMLRHVVPGVTGAVATLTMIELGRFVLVLSTLSFLGFGVRAPNPEWGAMLADARTSFFLAPRLLVYPGLAITLLVLSVNLMGDGLRDALAPAD